MIKIEVSIKNDKIKNGHYKWIKPTKKELYFVKKILKEFNKDIKKEIN
jgi:hypothetical protein